MTDRRLYPANGRIIDADWPGDAPGLRPVAGEAAMVAAGLADLCDALGGARDRQLKRGARVAVFERREGWAFLRHEGDGYVGYLPEAALGAPRPVTHRVIARQSHALDGPKVQAPLRLALPMDARLEVLGAADGWAETDAGFVPEGHLAPLDAPAKDPVAIAERLLGAPYFWGGNSAAGIDCSGLVQMGFAMCNLPCAGDADLQEASLGDPLPEGAALRRGDVIFWAGHVGLMRDEATLIHANAHSMSVASEPFEAACARIARREYGAVRARRRVSLPAG